MHFSDLVFCYYAQFFSLYGSWLKKYAVKFLWSFVKAELVDV